MTFIKYSRILAVFNETSDEDEKQEKETAKKEEEYFNVELTKSDSVAERSKELKAIEDKRADRKKLGREILGMIFKNGRTESTTPLIDDDYDDDDSNKEEDCKLDLDKVAYFKGVCNQFQKENLNDRVELLRFKGFDELDNQINNLDLEKLKKDLPKIKKEQNPTKEKGNNIEPPRRSFELDRPGSNITDPARKSFTGIHQSLLDYDSYYSDDGQQSRQSLDLPLLKHQQIFHKESKERI
uniref:Uncharacterized protein n=1 Tax=Meloidogyne javanica TaxID=6303 RepID=A0A915MBV4_MELJA